MVNCLACGQPVEKPIYGAPILVQGRVFIEKHWPAYHESCARPFGHAADQSDLPAMEAKPVTSSLPASPQPNGRAEP